MPKTLVDLQDDVVPVHVIAADGYGDWLEAQDDATRAWLRQSGFKGEGGQARLIPGGEGLGVRAVYVPGGDDGRGGPWAWAPLQNQLPTQGVYVLEGALGGDGANDAANDAALGFALAGYRYDRYRSQNDGDEGPFLVWPEGADRPYVRAAFGAATLARDLINTPASDLGPAELAHAARDLAEASGAAYSEVVGVDLIREGYPAIYAVGRGAEEGRAPRLVDFSWSPDGDGGDLPKVTLVGKGVCFDSGGLDIKPASAMRLMKKDMGGAAQALALASMIMALKVPVRLRVLVAAVENSVSATAMRPLDVVATRKGLSVEIGNTDAEGRVILADALALACEETPDLLVDFATLTGAARVALGTELPALFSNDDAFAQDILDAGARTADPMWRLPLWQPYKKQTKSKVADLKNDTDGPYGGAITAGLFLESFVAEGVPWAHIDVMAWNVAAQPGRPEGGEAMGVRALFNAIQDRFGE